MDARGSAETRGCVAISRQEVGGRQREQERKKERRGKGPLLLLLVAYGRYHQEYVCMYARSTRFSLFCLVCALEVNVRVLFQAFCAVVVFCFLCCVRCFAVVAASATVLL